MKALLHQIHAAPLHTQASLVGVCVVDVVLDPPWLEGEDERCKHECANDVLHKPVLVEATVTSIMANHKELQHLEVCRPSVSAAPHQK